MKKKTVISISIILFSLCSTESCRQDEMDMAPENTSLVQKGKQKTTYQKTENDTVKTASNLQFDDSGVEIADPPPKDKDQWRH
ncbi:hypothetical protein [Chryseobacterium camelliae]|uniref:hypothetical protein n=1 Tax=Chryseobacterium camelliae TaxID=1265445 RepID=UPI0012FE31FD|nr:hypothetical protein [Chryseobacterium camelliae]